MQLPLERSDLISKTFNEAILHNGFSLAQSVMLAMTLTRQLPAWLRWTVERAALPFSAARALPVARIIDVPP